MIVGDRAPDFTLSDHTGRTRSLSGMLADGPVVLFFFPLASSPICTAEACHFRELGREFESLGVQRVGISTDTVAKQARFASQRAFDYPLLSDTRAVVSGEFGVRRSLLARLGQALIRRQDARHGRHSQRRLLVRLLLAAKRATFVIDIDRTVLKIVSSELRASVHADLALAFLRDRKADSGFGPGSPALSVPAQRSPDTRVRVSLRALRGEPS